MAATGLQQARTEVDAMGYIRDVNGMQYSGCRGTRAKSRAAP